MQWSIVGNKSINDIGRQVRHGAGYCSYDYMSFSICGYTPTYTVQFSVTCQIYHWSYQGLCTPTFHVHILYSSNHSLVERDFYPLIWIGTSSARLHSSMAVEMRVVRLISSFCLHLTGSCRVQVLVALCGYLDVLQNIYILFTKFKEILSPRLWILSWTPSSHFLNFQRHADVKGD